MVKLIGFLVGSALAAAVLLAVVEGGVWWHVLTPPPPSAAFETPPAPRTGVEPRAMESAAETPEAAAETLESAADADPPDVVEDPALQLLAASSETVAHAGAGLGPLAPAEPTLEIPPPDWPTPLVFAPSQQGWTPIWQPFLSELSARGFAHRLSRLTDFDYRVSRIAAGRYQVELAYDSAEERNALLARIESITGLSLVDAD
jgi:hypothetical protein